MSDLRYTEEHEWLNADEDLVTVGITDFAQGQLGDIVFIELPEEGTEVVEGADVVVIESVKAAGEVSAPVSGVIAAVNEALAEAPETVNEDPLESGWLFKIRPSAELNLSNFMDDEAYEEFLETC